MHRHKRLIDTYRFKGYSPDENLTGIFGDSKARVIHLKRLEKKQFVHYVELLTKVITTERHVEYAIFPMEICEFISTWRYGVFNAGDVRK